MRKIVLTIIAVFIALATIFGVTYATTDEGDRVILYSDGSWKYLEQSSEWEKLFSTSGSSSKTTQKFVITSQYWRVKAESDTDIFSLYLRDSDGNMIRKILSLNAPGSDVTYITGKGTYLIEIIASGEYKITVEEERSDTLVSSSSPKSSKKTPYNPDSLLYSIIFEGDILNNMNVRFGESPEIIFLKNSMGETHKVEEGVYGISYDSFWEDESGKAFAFYRFSDNKLYHLGIMLFVPEGITKSEAVLGILDRLLYEYGEPEFKNYDEMFFVWRIASDISVLFGYSEATEQGEQDTINFFFLEDAEY